MRTLLQVGFLLAVVFGLIRIFPLALKYAEAAALSIRNFWWLILMIALVTWVGSVLRKRNAG